MQGQPPVIRLARYYQPPHLDTTIGEMDVRGISFWTIERGWHGNTPSISCVPTGTYVLKRDVWYRGDRDDLATFGLETVTGRSRILIHPANNADELEGCIGVGDSVGWMRGKLAVLNSVAAHERFMRIMQDVAVSEQIRIYQARGET